MKKLIFALAAFAALACSCNKEQDPGKTQVPDFAKFVFKLNVTELSSNILDNIDFVFKGTDFGGEAFNIPVTGLGEYAIELENPDMSVDYAVKCRAEVSLAPKAAMFDQVAYDSSLEYAIQVAAYDKEGNLASYEVASVVKCSKTGVYADKDKYAYAMFKCGNEMTEYAFAKGEYQGKINFGWQSEKVPEIEYGGYTYKTIKVGKQTWMAEPLRYVPEGETVSGNPNDANANIVYPYTATDDFHTIIDTTFFPDTDTIKTLSFKDVATGVKIDTTDAKGYLYKWDFIFGEAIVEANYNKLEGKKGICPFGWHVPTKDEWKGLLGNVNGESADSTSAPLYDPDYKGAKLTAFKEAGFDFVPVGCALAGSYNKTWISKWKTTDSTLFALPALTYMASSTGKSKTQMYAPATTYSAVSYADWQTGKTVGKYPEGRLNVMYGNIAKGFVQVRCIKDSSYGSQKQIPR